MTIVLDFAELVELCNQAGDYLEDLNQKLNSEGEADEKIDAHLGIKEMSALNTHLRGIGVAIMKKANEEDNLVEFGDSFIDTYQAALDLPEWPIELEVDAWHKVIAFLRARVRSIEQMIEAAAAGGKTIEEAKEKRRPLDEYSKKVKKRQRMGVTDLMALTEKINREL